MQIVYHYLRLRQHFANRQEGEAQAITLHELAEILCCTERNVKKIIKQLVEQGWIEWTPGRGRGIGSQLVFLRSVEQIVMPLAKAQIEQGDLERAMQLLQESRLPAGGRERFFDWLSGQFGFHSQIVEERTLDTLRMSFYRTIPRLDPAFVNRRTESHMVRQIFDTLISYDAKEHAYKPRLAHHWETNAAGTEWTFYLRKGVLFHHGRELTAQDVVRTLERVADPQTGSPYRWMLEDVERMAALGANVLHIRLRRPNRLLPACLASDRLSIVPVDMVQQKGEEFSRLPVGSGPFRLVTNDEQQFVLEAFPAYFQGRAHLDRVEIWVVPQFDKRSEKFFATEKEVHFQTAWSMPKPLGSWQELKQVERGATYLAFNLNRQGPQQNRTFRQAVDSILSRKQMIAELKGNRYGRAYSFFPEVPGIEPALAAGSREEKQAAVKDSGYRGERLKLYTYEGAGNENNVEWVQQQLMEYGVHVDVTIVPIETLKKPEVLLQADLVLAGEVFDEQWILGMVEFFRSDISFARNLWNPALRERIDRELELLAEEQGEEGQQRRLRRIEMLLAERCALLFLYHTRQHSVYHSALAGVSLNALGQANYKDIWFKQAHIATPK
ncbi:SgrR family transcriptional regulator [Brevibacillus parabrevis]|nr:SgrR family transcriptional regulator [Brevibacillus parabrevis]MBU8715725.1 SgrR family transcriptional regulator [Brevibacillus parabrevis]